MYVMRNLMEMITASKNIREAIKSSLTQKWACSKITEVQWISLTKYLRDLDLYIAWPTIAITWLCPLWFRIVSSQTKA